ncbi:MAG TPA: deoxyguanosinetriphosphate triphosphohydrolase [Micropepsaceae bacterium]|nr:deoxyguanosinetriphosphate triphosphohydrolase [Micropepsaceae bacterium]
MSKRAPAGQLMGPLFVRPPPAPYATYPSQSRGRFWSEPESPTRSCYQRDRDRIIHSTAFRRLKHKTQVFVQHEGDYYRTRLTHSLEVAQIGRSVSRVLGLDEDIAEAVALAHDLGHPPFGHSGEAALDECMSGFGGFDHNAHTLALVSRLEHRYADFEGLNLTWECLEGIVKHNGPLQTGRNGRDTLPEPIASFQWDLELHTHAGLEAQVAAMADDIAYVSHDLDDGLRAGLFGPDILAAAPLAGLAFREVQNRYPGLELGRLIGESVSRIITMMVSDLIAETRRRVKDLAPHSAVDVRNSGRPTAGFSGDASGEIAGLKSFLTQHMYRHPRVLQVMRNAQDMLTRLFGALHSDPSLLPSDWRLRCGAPRDAATAHAVCDYVAGMTDRFAAQEFRRIFHTDFPL